MIVKKLKNLFFTLFYDPYRFVRKHDNINVHPSSILLKSALFTVHSNNRITIGKDSMIGCKFIFESNKGEIIIGDRTYIGGSTKLISRTRISIGNDVTIAWGGTIYDHDSHSIDWRLRRQDITQQLKDYRSNNNFIANKNWDVVETKPILIEDKVWIGFDCAILKGTTIGEGAVVGARSVVRKDVEPWTVVAGDPATVLYKIDENKRRKL